jgi:phage gpG-like protein
MADKWGAKATGVKETLQNAETMGLNVKSCVRSACWRLAGKIATQAKRNVQTLVIPKSAGGTTTGRLAGSVTIAANFSNATAMLGKKAEPSDGLQPPGGNKEDSPFAIVGSNVEYARRIEHGFVGQDSLGRTYNQSPKPYLHPAFFALENDLPQTLKDLVDEKQALQTFNRRLPIFDPGGAWE